MKKELTRKLARKVMIPVLVVAFYGCASSQVFAKEKTPLSICLKANINRIDVLNAQRAWAKALVAIGRIYRHDGNYKAFAKKQIAKLYAYNMGKPVLFKPTKALKKRFRGTPEGALSYFVNGNSRFKEDDGFALEPWKKVRFHNDRIFYAHDIAIAMGYYTFYPRRGDKVQAEYTLGYLKDKQGDLKIFLQHSSLPYDD